MLPERQNSDAEKVSELLKQVRELPLVDAHQTKALALAEGLTSINQESQKLAFYTGQMRKLEKQYQQGSNEKNLDALEKDINDLMAIFRANRDKWHGALSKQGEAIDVDQILRGLDFYKGKLRGEIPHDPINGIYGLLTTFVDKLPDENQEKNELKGISEKFFAINMDTGGDESMKLGMAMLMQLDVKEIEESLTKIFFLARFFEEKKQYTDDDAVYKALSEQSYYLTELFANMVQVYYEKLGVPFKEADDLNKTYRARLENHLAKDPSDYRPIMLPPKPTKHMDERDKVKQSYQEAKTAINLFLNNASNAASSHSNKFIKALAHIKILLTTLGDRISKSETAKKDNASKQESKIAPSINTALLNLESAAENVPAQKKLVHKIRDILKVTAFGKKDGETVDLPKTSQNRERTPTNSKP